MTDKILPDRQTRAIHSGVTCPDTSGAVIAPLYLTSTFAHGNQHGYDYTRSGNPNFDDLASTIASLEGARYATVFSSGVGAITALASTLQSGDVILAEENLYGCTYRLFEQVFKKFGLQVHYFDFTGEAWQEAVERQRPKIVWIESPTNPLLKLIDIHSVAGVCQSVGSTLIVDNTFASPALQRPLEMGADISISSTTKYLNGHSDCIGGVVCSNSKCQAEKMIFAQKALGLNPSPFDCWLISRGIKTLGIRMERHCENALHVAEFFESVPAAEVHYPFLPRSPYYDIAQTQMSGGGGIVTVDFGLSKEETFHRLKNLSYFTLAESLGGVESLVCHPASMTHASVPCAVREAVGITDSLVRFSVGIERIDDLLGDLKAQFPQSLSRSALKGSDAVLPEMHL